MTGLSAKIRELARTRYVCPAVAAGRGKLSIKVRDVLNDLEAQGIYGAGRTPQICSSLQTDKFLKANGLEIESVDGPAKKQSPTVVIHYRVTGSESASVQCGEVRQESSPETSEEWAHRMTGKLFGLMKDEIASIGGAEAFIRWVRSEDDDSATESAA